MRFTVGTVTGWTIPPAVWNTAEVGTKGDPKLIAHVYDRAYCYRPIAVFGPSVSEQPLREAKRLADKLNREEDAWRLSLSMSMNGSS